MQLRAIHIIHIEMIEILSPLQINPSNMFLDNHRHIVNPLTIPERIPEDSDSTSSSSDNSNMGIAMIDSAINEFGKRPLHTTHDAPSYRRSSAGAGMSSNKRGKVFSSPSVEQNLTSSCYECNADDSHTDQDQEAQPAVHQQDDMIFRPQQLADDGNALEPTAHDYANLFFCDSSEEDETRANLFRRQSSVVSEPQEESSASIASADVATSSKNTNKKRRQVSFGASLRTIHLLHDVPPAHAMTLDEKTTLWFNRSDLEQFKSWAQTSIQEMRSRIVGNAQVYKDRSKFRSMMLTLESESDSSIRGLEHRVFRRKQTRQMLIRDVLECQAHTVVCQDLVMK